MVLTAVKQSVPVTKGIRTVRDLACAFQTMMTCFLLLDDLGKSLGETVGDCGRVEQGGDWET